MRCPRTCAKVTFPSSACRCPMRIKGIGQFQLPELPESHVPRHCCQAVSYWARRDSGSASHPRLEFRSFGGFENPTRSGSLPPRSTGFQNRHPFPRTHGALDAFGIPTDDRREQGPEMREGDALETTRVAPPVIFLEAKVPSGDKRTKRGSHVTPTKSTKHGDTPRKRRLPGSKPPPLPA